MDVVIYARASLDRTGEELSVTRQVEDEEKLATARGWRVVGKHIDNNISAAGKQNRPGFDAMLKAIEDGRTQCILAWDMSRLSRNARDTLRLLEIGKAHNTIVAFVRGSDLDLSTPAGRLTAEILSSVAKHEIEQKSDRQKRAIAQAAGQGRRAGGRRPFGYESDGMTIKEDEAQALRDAYKSVLSGRKLGRIAADWNAQGLRTGQRPYRHGCEDEDRCPSTVRARQCPRHQLGDEYNPWEAQNIRSVLLNPRNAGLRSHLTAEMRETVTNVPKARLDAIVGRAAWPAIIDEQTWRAAVAQLTDPARANPARSERGLLTGVGLCGVCAATVHAGGGPARNGREPYPTYRCRASLGHLGRAAGPVDWLIGEIVIKRLSRKDARDLLIDDERHDVNALKVEAADLAEQIDGLARLFTAKVLTEAGVRRESDRLRKKLGDVEAKLTDAGRLDVLGPLILADDVRAAWTAFEVDRRRAAIGVLMWTTLRPPGRGVRFGLDTLSWEANARRIRDTIDIDWIGRARQ